LLLLILKAVLKLEFPLSLFLKPIVRLTSSFIFAARFYLVNHFPLINFEISLSDSPTASGKHNYYVPRNTARPDLTQSERISTANAIQRLADFLAV